VNEIVNSAVDPLLFTATCSQNRERAEVDGNSDIGDGHVRRTSSRNGLDDNHLEGVGAARDYRGCGGYKDLGGVSAAAGSVGGAGGTVVTTCHGQWTDVGHLQLLGLDEQHVIEDDVARITDCDRGRRVLDERGGVKVGGRGRPVDAAGHSQ